jgi:hypothetical protein
MGKTFASKQILFVMVLFALLVAIYPGIAFASSLRLDPSSGEAPQGGSTTTIVTMRSFYNAYHEFSCPLGLEPRGISCSFSQTSCPGDCTISATISVPESVPVGVYTITLAAENSAFRSSEYCTGQYILTVKPKPQAIIVPHRDVSQTSPGNVIQTSPDAAGLGLLLILTFIGVITIGLIAWIRGRQQLETTSGYYKPRISIGKATRILSHHLESFHSHILSIESSRFDASLGVWEFLVDTDNGYWVVEINNDGHVVKSEEVTDRDEFQKRLKPGWKLEK